MNVKGLLAALSTDRILPWSTAAREFGLPATPDPVTRTTLAEEGVMVKDFEAKRTAGARNVERLLIVYVTTDPDPTSCPWHTVVQYLGLAAGRRQIGVQADSRFWDAHPHRNVVGDPGRLHQFKAGAFGDGLWHEYDADGHRRTWILEYSSGEQSGALIAGKVRAYGRQPQCWFTDSVAHARAIMVAFREVLPGFPDLRVEVVCWPGDCANDEDGRLSPAPRKEKGWALPVAPLTESTESAVTASRAPESVISLPVTLDAFLRSEPLFKPGEVAAALDVDVPRVGQVARELEALLGAKLERYGKDRRFTRLAVGVLRRAQSRAGLGVTFEVALRDELVTVGLVSAAGRDEAVQVVLQRAGEQAVSAVEHLVRAADQVEVRLGQVVKESERQATASAADVEVRHELLRAQTAANQQTWKLVEKLHDQYQWQEKQLDEIRKLTLQERASRSERRTFWWMLVAGMWAVLLVQAVTWLVSRLG